MENAFIKESTLTEIANAIRAKTGLTAAMLPSAMAGAITGIQAGGKSGSYVWSKRGMADSTTEDTTSGTYQLLNADRHYAEIEYSTTAPTYDASKRQWIFANSTKVGLSISDPAVPQISGNVYCRDMSEPNVWYLVSAFHSNPNSPFFKGWTYSKKYTAAVDWAKKYLTDIDANKYPKDGWLDGYYYKRTVADPNRTSGGKDWIQSNVTSGDFDSVCYGDGLWVAAGGYGSALYYSIDGEIWTRSNITSSEFYSVHYANNLWVAGGANGLYYSTDGKVWTQSNATSSSFRSLYYANSIWVAGSGSNKGLWYSTDGKVWTQSNITSGTFYSVYYGNDIWVAGTYTGNGAFYSIGGKTWHTISGNSDQVNSIYYANGLWVTAGSGLCYSTDGQNWTKSNITSGTFNSVYYSNSIWVAASNTGLYYSTDGKVWTQSNITSGTFNSVYYSNGIWVVGGDNNGLYYSQTLSVEVDF